MKTITFADDYDAALTVLALRSYATDQFAEAVAKLKAGDGKGGDAATRRGQDAGRVADQIQES